MQPCAHTRLLDPGRVQEQSVIKDGQVALLPSMGVDERRLGHVPEKSLYELVAIYKMDAAKRSKASRSSSG